MSMYEYDDARASIPLATEIGGVASRHSFEMSDQQLEDFAFKYSSLPVVTHLAFMYKHMGIFIAKGMANSNRPIMKVVVALYRPRVLPPRR